MTDDRRDARSIPFGMTDLEERLRVDGGELRVATLSRLAQLGRDIDAMVDRGLTRNAFLRARTIQDAVKTAHEFLLKQT